MKETSKQKNYPRIEIICRRCREWKEMEERSPAGQHREEEGDLGRENA